MKNKLIRLDDDLFIALKERADIERRTVNNLIMILLNEALKKRTKSNDNRKSA